MRHKHILHDTPDLPNDEHPPPQSRTVRTVLEIMKNDKMKIEIAGSSLLLGISKLILFSLILCSICVRFGWLFHLQHALSDAE